VADRRQRSAPAEGDVAVLARRRPVDLARLIPSARSVALALALLATAGALYLLARETSLFALQRVEVTGAPPDVARAVQRALRPLDGKSLVTLDGARVEQRLEQLPVVASATYDRDFPHTLNVTVRPERPVLVLRRGPQAWLVSARARVMRRLQPGEERALPRIWATRSVQIVVGGTLGGDAGRGVAVAGPLVRTTLARRAAAIRATDDGLAVVLSSGLELRLGDLRNLRVKLAVGARIAALVGGGADYVDLTVPGRPVSGANPQVEGSG